MNNEQPQAKTEAPADANEPVFHDDNKKSTPTGLIIGMVLLALIAIGGVGFGVWEMTSQGQKVKDLETQVANCAAANGNESTENVTVTCPDGSEVEVETVNVIDNASAQTIIDPYLVHFGAFSNLLDFEFDTDAKMKVAFDNMGANQAHAVTTTGEWAVTVSYDDFVRTYKNLFGSSQEVEKRDYDTDYADFTYIDGTPGSFKVNLGGIGGTGSTMFSVVKKAYYSGDNLLIEVYHGLAHWCVEERTDACVAIYSLANSEEIKKYVNDYAESIPVYTMTFAKDNGHYVLTNIQKQ